MAIASIVAGAAGHLALGAGGAAAWWLRSAMGDGAFSVRDLPAGDYLLAALTDFEARDFDDRSFFNEMAGPRQAIAVTVRDGVDTRQDSRVAR